MTKKKVEKPVEEKKVKATKQTQEASVDPYTKSLIDAGYVLTDVEGDKVWVKK